MAKPSTPELEQHYLEEVGERGARWLRSRYADWILGAIAFAESVFAPILIDPFLIALILARPERWIRYVWISIIFSLTGGVVAYFLGALFYDVIGTWIVNSYGLENQFSVITRSVDENGFVFVLLGALTPIPYKLVALASGVVQVNLMTFVVASIVGRILRLGLVGWATYLVGPRALPVIRRHLLLLTSILGVLLLGYLLYRIF
ncbi:MAG: VTT domain-containing protein [Bacteroidota bacterium]